MPDICATLRWIPVPKQSFRRGNGRNYPNPKVVKDADALCALLSPYAPSSPMAGPVELTVEVVYPWRKSEKKRIRALGWYPKDTKPDDDNVRKQVADVLERMGFIADDGQIAVSHFAKGWGDSAPLTKIRLRTMDEDDVRRARRMSLINDALND
jgi:Holliday junction resolvase RusA-like endonuclease